MNRDESVPLPVTSSQPELSNNSAAGSQWNNGITRRSFLKRSGGATAATIIAWNLSVQPTQAAVYGAWSVNNLDYIWIVYEYTSSVDQSFTGTGNTPGAALDSLNTQINNAGVTAGSSKVLYTSDKVDTKDMESIFWVTPEDGAAILPTSTTGVFTSTANLTKGSRYRVTRWR